MIKAIETEYKGYRFRSRLEARWAVFFDAIEIEYQYEPEGFLVSAYNMEDDEEKIPYLPDFYLPKYKCYVEVKGSDEALEQDKKKILYAVDWGGPCRNGLLILGNIPDPEEISFANIPMFSYLYNDKGVAHEYAVFTGMSSEYPWIKRNLLLGTEKIKDYMIEFKNSYIDSSELKLPEYMSTNARFTWDDISSYFSPRLEHTKKLKDAYKKARSARFEHGEKG